MTPSLVAKAVALCLYGLRVASPTVIDSLVTVVYQPQPDGTLRATAISTDDSGRTLEQVNEQLGRTC